jgi:hypothetical protein
MTAFFIAVVLGQFPCCILGTSILSTSIHGLKVSVFDGGTKTAVVVREVVERYVYVTESMAIQR